MDFHSSNCLVALGRPVSCTEHASSYDAGIKGVWLYYYLKSLVHEHRANGKLWAIFRREIKSIRGTRFDIRDNLDDFSPIFGLILKLFINRKGHD